MSIFSINNNKKLEIKHSKSSISNYTKDKLVVFVINNQQMHNK